MAYSKLLSGDINTQTVKLFVSQVSRTEARSGSHLLDKAPVFLAVSVLSPVLIFVFSISRGRGCRVQMDLC